MNQPAPFMTFNQELAEKSGGGTAIQDGGAHICTIEHAVYTKAKTGSHGVEFTIKTDDGLTGRYITQYFAKANREPINSGYSLLNALMGFCGINGLNWAQTTINGESCSHCPELAGKRVGLFLQKRLYTKESGQDGYDFSIVCPFDPATNKTFKEKSQNKEAQAIARMSASYSDKDERKASPLQNANAGSGASNGAWPDEEFPM